MDETRSMPGSSHFTTSRRAAAVSCLGFVAAIWLPLAGAALGIERGGTAAEKRNAALRPRWEWSHEGASTFPGKFEAWYRDSFGFRQGLIRSHNSFKFHLLRVSPTQSVVLGKDGWLFLNWRIAIANYQGFPPVGQGILNAWAYDLQHRKDWLAARGVKFATVIFPDKATLYPELMPDTIPRTSGPKALDQFIGYMRQRTNVPIIDVREAMREGKQRGHQVHYKLDTHWTRIGAFFGYQAVMAETRPLVPMAVPIAHEEMTFTPGPRREADLIRFMNLLAPPVEHDTTVRRAGGPRVRQLQARGRAGRSLEETGWNVRFRGTGDARSGSVMLVGDSYAAYLAEYLFATFGRVAHVSRAGGEFTTIDDALGDVIAEERPDLLILGFVERHIRRRPLDPVLSDP